MNLSESPAPGQPFLQHPRVTQLRRSLCFVWFFMIITMASVCYVVFRTMTQPLPLDAGVVGTIGAVLAFASLIFPDWLARRLNSGPAQDPMGTLVATLILDFILRFIMTETALILLVMVYQGAPAMAMAIYGASCGIMLFHFPSESRFLQIASR